MPVWHSPIFTYMINKLFGNYNILAVEEKQHFQLLDETASNGQNPAEEKCQCKFISVNFNSELPLVKRLE